MIALCLLIIILSLILYQYYWMLTYWKKQGVFSPKPLPLVGNTFDLATFSKPAGEIFKKIYESSTDPYLGFFLIDQPILLVKDPQLIKRILLNDFNVFRDRSMAEATNNEIFSNFLLLSRSGRWKELRNQLTPLFTSGKLKGMVNTINEVCEELVTQISKSKQPVCTKDVYTKFITEVIARSFFNIGTKCLDDDQSVFREILKKMFHPSWKTLIVQLFYFVRISWVNYFGLNFIDGTAVKYMINVFTDVIDANNSNNNNIDIKKPKDIVEVMIRGKISEDEKFGKVGHFASGVQFFVAGVETTSTGLSWFMFEMCQRPDIQEKLRNDIIDVLKKHNGEITWESLQEMKYLDMCYYETLRRYPFVPFLDRQALEDYKVEETGFVIKKGTSIFIPLYALSLDAKYYPDPYEFKPERFAKSNHAHANDNGLVYMPFGAGQRICIGERYAILASKQVIIATLLNFKLEKCDKTPPYPANFNPKTTFLECEGGIPVKFTPISTKF